MYSVYMATYDYVGSTVLIEDTHDISIGAYVDMVSNLT